MVRGDALVGEAQGGERVGIHCRHCCIDLGFAHGYARLRKIEPVEPLGIIDESRVALFPDARDDIAHDRVDILRYLTLSGEECGEVGFETSVGSIEAQWHGRRNSSTR